METTGDVGYCGEKGLNSSHLKEKVDFENYLNLIIFKFSIQNIFPLVPTQELGTGEF